MNKAYEFISYPYESFAPVPKTTSTLAIHDQDISLDDMLLEFTNFLRAAGYVIDSDQYLSIVSDEELEDYEEEDYEGLWDDEEDEDPIAEFGKMFESLKYSSSDLFEGRMLSALDKDIDKAFDRDRDIESSGRNKWFSELAYVTRVEVIDSTGRVYSSHDASSVAGQLQDEGRTFKVFVK